MQSRRIYAFDVMGTLLDVSSLRERVETVSQNAAEFLQMWRRKQLEYSWLSTIMDRSAGFWKVTERAMDYTLKQYGIDASDADRSFLMDGWLHLEPFEESAEVLESLSSRKVALTNADMDMARGMLGNAGLLDKIEHVFSADRVGRYKPYSKVYHQVPVFYGVKYAEVSLVSSNAWDVTGALNSGIGAVYVNRNGTPQESISQGLAREIPDLLGLIPD